MIPGAFSEDRIWFDRAFNFLIAFRYSIPRILLGSSKRAAKFFPEDILSKLFCVHTERKVRFLNVFKENGNLLALDREGLQFRIKHLNLRIHSRNKASLQFEAGPTKRQRFRQTILRFR